MRLTSRKIAVLCMACAALVLATSSFGGAQETDYIPGLSISLEGAPDVVSTGETFSMQVKITKPAGIAVSGRLRTYLYASIDQVTYPPPDPGFEYIPVNEGSWVPNEIVVTLSESETEATHDFSLTVRSDLVFASGSTAEAKLRARFRKIGINETIAPDSDKTVYLGRGGGEETGFGLPFELKVIIAVVVVMAVVGAAVYLALRGRGAEEMGPL